MKHLRKTIRRILLEAAGGWPEPSPSEIEELVAQLASNDYETINQAIEYGKKMEYLFCWKTSVRAQTKKVWDVTFQDDELFKAIQQVDHEYPGTNWTVGYYSVVIEAFIDGQPERQYY